MKKLMKALVIALVGLAQVAQGQEIVHEMHGDDFHPMCQEDITFSPYADSNYIISGELLYLKPSMDQASYVISSTNNFVGDEFFPDGQRHNNNANYKPGFRVGALYEFCSGSNALDLRFTYFDGGHTASITGDFLYDTLGFPGDGAISPEDIYYTGTATAHDNYKYYAFDATFNRVSFNSIIDNLYFLVGLHFAEIKHTKELTSVGSAPGGDDPATTVDNFLKSHSRFWGIGPQMGIDYRYTLTPPQCCYGEFSLLTNMRASLLCSNTRASFHYNTPRTEGSAGVNLHNDSVWRVNPAFDAKLGGCYLFCLFNYASSIELGYEWLWYSDSIDSITGYDVAFAGNSIDVFSNLNLHGPFLKLNIAF